MTTETAPAPRRGYLARWRTAPAEFAYLFVKFPIAILGTSVTFSLFGTGLGTIITFFIGVFLVIATLYVARGFGTLDLAMLEWAGQPEVRRPDWGGTRTGGFFAWLRSVLGNAHYWLYLLHTSIVDMLISTLTWSISFTWAVTGLSGVSYWFWGSLIPARTDPWYVTEWLASLLPFRIDGVNHVLADYVLGVVIGSVFLATLPFITRGLIRLHRLVAGGMLGAFRSDALRREVATLEESRGAAIAAEGHSLRRLERDIHDGPQQRLVRLQMDLAAAERQLGTDETKARELITEAMQQSKDALEELRSLSRGFAPPILMDRGLVAALESTAVRSPIPAHVVDELPEGTVLPQEIERNAYFVASEALANAAKHSGASEVELRVGLRDGSRDGERVLEVTVTDDGRGCAKRTPGHGLAGLEERLRGLGGTLTVSSPSGGPTVVSALVPLAAS